MCIYECLARLLRRIFISAAARCWETSAEGLVAEYRAGKCRLHSSENIRAKFPTFRHSANSSTICIPAFAAAIEPQCGTKKQVSCEIPAALEKEKNPYCFNTVTDFEPLSVVTLTKYKPLPRCDRSISVAPSAAATVDLVARFTTSIFWMSALAVTAT